jgi:hypothetical protein
MVTMDLDLSLSLKIETNRRLHRYLCYFQTVLTYHLDDPDPRMITLAGVVDCVAERPETKRKDIAYHFFFFL